MLGHHPGQLFAVLLRHPVLGLNGLISCQPGVEFGELIRLIRSDRFRRHIWFLVLSTPPLCPIYPDSKSLSKLLHDKTLSFLQGRSFQPRQRARSPGRPDKSWRRAAEVDCIHGHSWGRDDGPVGMKRPLHLRRDSEGGPRVARRIGLVIPDSSNRRRRRFRQKRPPEEGGRILSDRVSLLSAPSPPPHDRTKR